MTLKKENMETKVKRELAKLYKGAFGKGPENTEAKIHENFLYLKFTGAFSTIEESLLRSLPGREIVSKIRDELILTQTSVYVPTIENITCEKVKDIKYMMDDNKNCLYMFILFENEININ